jgi:glutamate formiminotransferase/formiminotetrahydrofolate cyclodeaminase
MEVIVAMAEIGLPASASDAGVAALCARSAVLGAYLNVLINAKELTNGERARSFVEGGAALRDEAMAREAKILEVLAEKI